MCLDLDTELNSLLTYFCFYFVNRYGVNNIRDLVGHKVNLNFVESNPAVRLEKE